LIEAEIQLRGRNMGLANARSGSFASILAYPRHVRYSPHATAQWSAPLGPDRLRFVD
jgi:hypothetical protein